MRRFFGTCHTFFRSSRVSSGVPQRHIIRGTFFRDILPPMLQRAVKPVLKDFLALKAVALVLAIQGIRGMKATSVATIVVCPVSSF